jgi:hypothetical protein
VRFALRAEERTTQPRTQVTIDRLGHDPSAFSVRRNDPFDPPAAPASTPEVRTGDDAFDAATIVRGASDLALALLTAETRALLSVLLQRTVPMPAGPVLADIRIEGGALTADLAARAFDDQSGIQLMRHMLGVAHRLAAPEDLAARLAENFETEPAAPVRARTVAVLAAEYSGDDRTLALARRAAGDRAAEVRLEAAVALGADGDTLLLELASDDGTPDWVAARAIAKLGGRLPADRAREVLPRAVRLLRRETAVACLRTLSVRADEDAVRALTEVLLRAPEEIALEAARALARAGRSSAEAALVTSLRHSTAHVKAAAAAALGRVGTAAAVPALQEAAATGPSAVREAAREAVAELQARLPGATPGQLSLAGGEAGQVSLPADSGQVTLTERKESG